MVMIQVNAEDNSSIYLILDGNKTTNKESFLIELHLLLKLKTDRLNTWEELKDNLNLISPIICSSFSDNPSNNIDKVIVIWLDPLDFSKYNSADFLVALDILKSVNDDQSNGLQFALASYVKHINTDLYR